MIPVFFSALPLIVLSMQREEQEQGRTGTRLPKFIDGICIDYPLVPENAIMMIVIIYQSDQQSIARHCKMVIHGHISEIQVLATV